MALVLEPTSQTFEPTYHQVVSDITSDQGLLDFDGDLTVQGSIGRGAKVRAQGSIIVQQQITGANIICSGELTASSASMVGGRVAAFRGVHCNAIGDARATPTQVVIGMDELALEAAERRVLEIRAARQKAEAFLKKLSPMLQVVKSLSAGQREQVTELLSQGQELQQRADTATEQLRARLIAAQDHVFPASTVTGELFAGVTFIFPGGACEIRSAIRGSIEIQPKRIGQTRSLQIKLLQTGKFQALQTISHSCRINELLDQLK